MQMPHPPPSQAQAVHLSLPPLSADPESLQLVTASLLVAGKTDVLLEDIRFLMHFLQTLISQTVLAQYVEGLLKYATN